MSAQPADVDELTASGQAVTDWLNGVFGRPLFSLLGAKSLLDRRTYGTEHAVRFAFDGTENDYRRLSEALGSGSSVVERTLFKFAHAAGVATSRVTAEIRFNRCHSGDAAGVRAVLGGNGVEVRFHGRRACFKSLLMSFQAYGDDELREVRHRLRAGEASVRLPAVSSAPGGQPSLGAVLAERIAAYYESRGGEVSTISDPPEFYEMRVSGLRGVVIKGSTAYAERLQVVLIVQPPGDEVRARLMVDGQWASGLGTPSRLDYHDMEPKNSAALSDHLVDLGSHLESELSLRAR